MSGSVEIIRAQVAACKQAIKGHSQSDNQVYAAIQAIEGETATEYKEIPAPLVAKIRSLVMRLNLPTAYNSMTLQMQAMQ